MTELQPCKCHNIPRVEKAEKKVYANLGFARGYFDDWYIKCDRCGKKFGDFLSRDSAVRAWNRWANNDN